ncbi:MAG: acetone carboxylase subunit alpha [Alteromonadaceae bacterium TMED7]|nr:MAG: acetone carboxylase subunit alpha [Alteromonadaceae bacterium TMED7]|tara:strand:- start:5489 stop:7759 length:2271 start_codon:yes stop_codon:yes gene_type:complete
MATTIEKDQPLSEQDQSVVDKFMKDNKLFYGPDQEIMGHHGLQPRSEDEERILTGEFDTQKANLCRGRILSALDESHTMIEQMGVAPGAKWGDIVTSIFTASGDMASTGQHGLVAFASVVGYPIRFINKYWIDDPTVGVRDGDAFIHNDSRYGNIHNTDQSMMMPVFHEGKLVCWVSSTIHEGENGAIEPGGMPSIAESKYDEGLKMSPFRVAEGDELRRDILTFLQNSVRDPKLQLADMKVKLHVAIRLRERVLAVIEEFGVDYLMGTMRKSLEDTVDMVKNRISEVPDGKYRINTFLDGTLRENLISKIPMEVEIKGERMIWNLQGAAPEYLNRSINSVGASFKTCLATGLTLWVWPDLPKNQASFAPVEVKFDDCSLVNSSTETPNAMSLLAIFRAFSLPAVTLGKAQFCMPKRFTAVSAASYNQPATMIYGGVTQHDEVTGNFCADINGNGTGGREDKDGEHSLSPIFGYMADTGEMELVEEELPLIRLVSQKLTKDRVGFGKYRSGQGYEQVATMRGSSMFGFMSGQCGAKFNTSPGLFGGYSCPAYPLAKIKNVNVLEILKEDPDLFEFDFVNLMNDQKLPGGDYSTQGAMNFEECQEGELYMICQGAGGGYGDVLDRAPEMVIKDLEEGLLSDKAARRMYKVEFNSENLVLDEEGTAKARADERQARIARGVPYDEFIESWVKDMPNPDIPYMGSWGDDLTKLVVQMPGLERRVIEAGTEGIMLPNPKDLHISNLEQELAELKTKLGDK